MRFIKIKLFISVTSFWGDAIVSRICSCVTIFKTCNFPITSVFWYKISKSFMYSPRQKIVIKTLFWRWRNGCNGWHNGSDIIFLLIFGKYQNGLTFSATFNFSSKLGTKKYSDSKSPWGDFVRSWWHLMTLEVHI